jgi:uncharacterized protein YeaC (DUF1315 family)
VDEELNLGVPSRRGWPDGVHLSAEVRAVAPQLLGLWLALGVSDAELRRQLVQRVLRRLQAEVERDHRPAGRTLAEQAVCETFAFIDDWLARVVGGVAGEPPDLMPFRAALLDGALPDWPLALLHPPAPGAREILLAAIPRPLPPPAPLAMPRAELRLRRFRPAAWVRRLLSARA